LIGVPFQYIVPDEKYLPPESLRFFHLDEDWIDALIDGAMSIGRTYSKATNTHPSALAEAAQHNKLHEHANGELGNHRLRQLSLEEQPISPTKFPDITGFLLRSQIVQGWKGLDFIAYEKGKSPYDYQMCQISSAKDVKQMEVLRLEPLANDVLLGIFTGTIYELVIHQPPEGIHFGFHTIDVENNKVTKTIRVPNNTWDNPKGYDAETYQNKDFEGIFYDQSSRPGTTTSRVVNMSQMSKLMAQKMATYNEPGNVNKAPGYYQANPDSNHRDHLLSSDFGLEMVHGVGLVSFINTPQDNKCT